MSQRFLKTIAVTLFLFFLILCAGEQWIFQTVGLMLVGWAFYLKRVIPEVQLNFSAIGLFAIVLPLAVVMTHAMLAWLWHGLGNHSFWRWKWTLASLTTIMLMFFVGMAATGIAHQTAWLINSPKPLTKSTFMRAQAQRIKCNTNLRLLYQALNGYRVVYPDFQPHSIADWADIILDQEILPDQLICPASDLHHAPATQPAELKKLLMTHTDEYVSFAIPPGGTLVPDAKLKVLLFDKTIDNHEDGINLLYDDGTTKWLENDEAAAFLASVHSPATTRPTAK